MFFDISLKGIERFFLSRRVAATLLVITLSLLIFSTRLQKVETLTASPYFLVIPLLIFTSTFLCTMNRIRTRRIKVPDAASFNGKRRIEAVCREELSDVADHLTGKGWTSVEKMDGTVVLAKGWAGFWGSVVFHGGLLLLLIATVTTLAASFRGEVLLTEGLPNPLGAEGLFKVWKEPMTRYRLPEGEIVLEKFEAVYRNERFPVDYIASARIKDSGGERPVETRVNAPLNLSSFQYTMDRYGFAPGFIIKDREGNILFDGYVNLILMDEAEDSFVIPGTDAQLLVRFFPDFYRDNGRPATRSRVPRNPVFGLKIQRKNAPPGSGMLVRMGEAVKMDGFSISPNDIRYWLHMGVARDPGKGVFAAAFFMIVVGLALRFVLHEKWLMISQREGAAEVSGYSRYFPALFEREVERIADEIGRL